MTREQAVAAYRAATKNVSKSTTIALWVCLGFSMALFVAAFFAPPKGEINQSVLRAVAEILGIAALFFAWGAVLEGLGVKLTHGETTIVVQDMDGKTAGKTEEIKTDE